ncbi:Uncharacterized conserved protein, DUF1800 family [Fontimonas thermophila]|uniref:Uncharacterized conserved protein, DUF1800 family n=1 Tax=Fontimonas thermophila TaxID=1076937 RepID=A0A1I2IG40_9GAMM|nr:DUF1800 domain-containing protein [Fontimonas thermophila]SFF40600.1 Uncharacterized conserved protein, DUF1800 family [Fontimonas thermophila]
MQDSPSIAKQLMTTAEAVQRRAEMIAGSRVKTAAGLAAQAQRREAYRNVIALELQYRLERALAAADPFDEALLRFWSNHFAVSTDKALIGWLAGPYEREALRPHLAGRFESLAWAAVTHPAMLLYLDNAQSVGPRSKAAQAHPRSGLNENLARELLELHTLGVRSGYTQADVVELAKVLTGWRLFEREGRWYAGFDATAHEPGPKTILGKTYAESGAQELEAVLADLARHPAARRFICSKLARHFLADDPPQPAVDRLVAAWGDAGDLAAVNAVLRHLLEDPERIPVKLRTPEELVIAALRAVPQLRMDARAAYRAIRQMGQIVWKPPSPAGWPDTAAEWLGPDAMWKRVEWANQWSMRVHGEIDVRALAKTLFGARLSEHTEQQIHGAESQAQALALLFVSPEFQRR